MPINSKRTEDRIVSRLESLGIDERVGQGESHTAKLVREIVKAVLFEITVNGEVIITNAQAATHLGPAPVTGKGKIL